MYFYILNIEAKKNHSLILYGKKLNCDEDDKIIDASKFESQTAQIYVENVISPIFMKAVEEKEEELKGEVDWYFKSKKVGYTVESVAKINIFYENLPKNVKILKFEPKSPIDMEDFFGDYSESIITEFYNPVENFIISRKIRGPCVIKIHKFTETQPNYFVTSSHKNIEFACNSPLPNITIASLMLELNNFDVCAYSLNVNGVINNGMVKTNTFENNKSAENEGYKLFTTGNSLLDALNELILSNDINCLVYHNVPEKVLQKLKISNIIKCDLFVFASGNIKSKTHSIYEMSSLIDYENIESLNRNTVVILNDFNSKIKILKQESDALLRIFFGLDVLALSKEMSEISGYVINKTFQNLRAERIEYTLLHELYKNDYLFPPLSEKVEVKYTGGLVLMPDKGFYENIVLLLDFNSLYPSIIQEFNVCFSTIGLIKRENTQELTEEEIIKFTDHSKSMNVGFLPKILLNFVTRRRSVKDLIKKSHNPDEIKILDVRQKALKLTANSIYGCLGYSGSRFCNYNMAAYITAKGRELLKEAKKIAENDLNMNVIYGDTDSVMIKTNLPGLKSNYSAALKHSEGIKKAINSKYKNIEIEIDGVFKKLLLIGKKKYASLLMDSTGKTTIEYKGLELVKRNFCKISSDASRSILEILLSDLEDKNVYKQLYEKDFSQHIPINDNNKVIEDAIYKKLTDIASSLNGLGVENFVIFNSLGKAPENYKEGVTPPHVTLALRLKKEKGWVFRQNDVIPYVIGKKDAKTPINKKAYHPTEKEFEIDFEYYVKNQILPPIFRILSILKNIKTHKISSIFGIVHQMPVEVRTKITLIMPCCANIQEPAKNCKKCNEEISENFYLIKVSELLRKETENLYKNDLICSNCESKWPGYLQKCLQCPSDVSITLKNDGFNILLDNLIDSFENLEFKEVNNLIELYTSNSIYRTLDLSDYFPQEISRAKREKFYVKNL